MRSLWCVLLVFLVAGQLANADDKDPNDPNELAPTESVAAIKDPNELKELWQAKWDAVILVLQNKDIDQKAKEQQTSKIVSPIFDFPLMAKLALGREHWPKLTPPQQEKFSELFVERLKSSYWDKIKLYTDEKVLLKPAVQNKKNKNTIYIPVELISKDKKTSILYKFRKMDPAPIEDERRTNRPPAQDAAERPDRTQTTPAQLVRDWKIYDVEIQGVSILLTYRSQFNDILRSGTIKDLLSQLEEPPTH